MARVTYVKRAQQRYAQKPVIDPATGEQKITPVINRRTGEQKVTKRGRAVVLRVTEDDKTKPLPPEKCGKCDAEILPGQPYKHISPKSGPYGGRRLVRCDTCPTWQVWEYSSSTSARVSQIQHEAESLLDQIDSATDPDEVSGLGDEIGGLIRELADEKNESADNIENGFGHETSQSQEIREVAEGLESWADEVESVDVPELEKGDCETCEGSGKVDCDDSDFHNEDREVEEGEECPQCGGEVAEPGEVDCSDCDGSGEPNEPGEDALGTWREEARQAFQDALDNCPV